MKQIRGRQEKVEAEPDRKRGAGAQGWSEDGIEPVLAFADWLNVP